MPARLADRHKLLRGTLRPGRTRRKRVTGRLARCPPPPAHLGETAAAEWRRLAPQAHALGTLHGCDLRAFELLCEVLATEKRARETVERDGLTVPTADGGAKAHPAVKAMEAARNQAHRLLADFGLTPRGRQGVDVQEETHDEWLAQFRGDPAEQFFG